MYSLETLTESLILFIDNSESIICFLNENTLPTSITKSQSLVIPPVMKIQKSIIAYLSDEPSNTQPLPKQRTEDMGLDENAVPDALFIELLPGGDFPQQVTYVTRDILLLAPLLRRYRLADENSTADHNNHNEWHYLVLKALATTKTNNIETGSETATAWTKHLQKAVLDLTPKYSSADEVQDIETWLTRTRGKHCPAFEKSILDLLSTSTSERGTLTQQRVQFHGNSVQINLSLFSYGVGNVTDVLSAACLVHLIQAAAVHPSVVSISLGSAYHFANYDAVAMSQSGTAYKQPFRAAGLSGRNQVCGVADTGLDGKFDAVEQYLFTS